MFIYVNLKLINYLIITINIRYILLYEYTSTILAYNIIFEYSNIIILFFEKWRQKKKPPQKPAESDNMTGWGGPKAWPGCARVPI